MSFMNEFPIRTSEEVFTRLSAQSTSEELRNIVTKYDGINNFSEK